MKPVIHGIKTVKPVENNGFLLPVGKYIAIIKASYTDEIAEKGQQTFEFKYTFVDGPNYPSGKSTIGREWTEWVRIPTKEAPNYSDGWFERSAGTLVAIANAIGYRPANR